MYKTHFRKWGLWKYVPRSNANSPAAKSGVADEAAPDRQSKLKSAEKASPIFRETVSGGTDTRVRRTEVMRTVTKASRSPTPPGLLTRTSRRLESPQQFKIPEECMYLIKHYLDQDRQVKGLGTLSTLRSTSKSELWMTKLILGAQLVLAGQYAQGFAVINLCFDQYTNFVTDQEPWLIFSTYVALYNLVRTERRLGQLFIRFACQMANLNISPRHPLHRLFTLMRQAGALGSRDHAIRLMECFLDTIAQYALSNDLFLMRSILKVYERFAISPTLSLPASDETVTCVIKQLRMTRPKEQILADIRDTKTGLKEAFVCQKQREYITAHGSPVLDQVDTEDDVLEASTRDAEILNGVADGIARFTAIEVRSQNYSATAVWSDLDMCLRDTGDEVALRQLTDVLPAIRAETLLLFT